MLFICTVISVSVQGKYFAGGGRTLFPTGSGEKVVRKFTVFLPFFGFRPVRLAPNTPPNPTVNRPVFDFFGGAFARSSEGESWQIAGAKGFQFERTDDSRCED